MKELIGCHEPRLMQVTEEEYQKFLNRFNPEILRVFYYMRTAYEIATFIKDRAGNVICARTNQEVDNEFYIHRQMLKFATYKYLLRKPARS